MKLINDLEVFERIDRSEILKVYVDFNPLCNVLVHANNLGETEYYKLLLSIFSEIIKELIDVIENSENLEIIEVRNYLKTKKLSIQTPLEKLIGNLIANYEILNDSLEEGGQDDIIKSVNDFNRSIFELEDVFKNSYLNITVSIYNKNLDMTKIRDFFFPNRREDTYTLEWVIY